MGGVVDDLGLDDVVADLEFRLRELHARQVRGHLHEHRVHLVDGQTALPFRFLKKSSLVIRQSET